MRRIKMKPLFVALVVGVIVVNSRVISAQSKEVTFTGKVIDPEGRPIAGAKVSLYNVTYDYEAHTAKSTPSGDVTNAGDGAFSFTTAAEINSNESRYIVAEKENRALGWADWKKRDNQQRDIVLGEPKELHGTVVDETGKPIPDTRVGIWLMALGEGQDQQSIGRPLAEQLLTSTTDSSGRFRFTNLPAEATVDFILRKTGRATVLTFRSTGYAYQKLTFAPDQADIKLTLPVEAKIQGTVVNKETGQPVDGAKLIVTSQNNQSVFGQKPVISKDDGSFSIDALTAGNYFVQLVRQREKAADWVAEMVRVTLEAGQTQKGVKIELAKGGLLEILVTEAGTSKPLDKASISLRDEKNKRWLSTRCDEEGMARIRLVPGGYQLNGIYKLGYRYDQYREAITIQEGQTKRLTYQVDSLPKITGIVRDPAGTPLEGVRLMILPGNRQETQSDSEGKFEIIWDKGSWGTREDTAFCLVARLEQRNLATTHVMSNDKKLLDLTLRPGVTFAGKILDVNGKGIPGAQVRTSLRLSTWGSSFSREQAKTDDNGCYEIRAIPPGHNYNVGASAEGYGQKNIDVHTDIASDNRLDVETITLPLAPLSISGQILDTEEHPVPDAQITGSGTDQPHPHTLSDEQGHFTLEGLCAGIVYINVNAGRLSARVHTDAGASNIRIVAREGRSPSYYIASKTDEEILQSNEKAISGVALDEKGAPVKGVPVSVCCHQKLTEDGRPSWHYQTFTGLSDITDEKGRFTIAIQEDGKYNLRFSPDHYAAMIVYDIPIGTKDLKVTLPEGGTVTGRLVKMEKGQKVPIPNVEVKIEQTDRASYTHLGFDRDRTTVTDAEGRFRFEHIRTKIRPMGDRTVEKWEPAARVWKISFGDTSKTIAFYEGNTIDNVELLVKPDISSSPSLIGNAMPGFESIKIDLPTDRIKNKKMLICFFDMNQRPSRHYILELAKQVEQLKQKNMTIAAVQASKIDENKLGEWVKKSKIAFPVGIAQGEEETRFSWGVRSLPWLVLTDSKHVVRAEGFAISELDQTLRQIP